MSSWNQYRSSSGYSSSSSDEDCVDDPFLTRALNCIYKVLDNYAYVSLESLQKDLKKSDLIVYRYFKKITRLEAFLEQHDDVFWVENGTVKQYSELFEETVKNAVKYFEETLEDYNERPLIKNFRGHIGQADLDIIDYVNGFYPGDDFKKFLMSQSDVFVVFADNTVALIENECVNYFKQRLETYGDNIYYRNFRGHCGQAPLYIRQHMKDNYPGEDFLLFLQEHTDTFYVDEEGNVFLNEEESSDYSDYDDEY